nr:Mitochondrial fission regulator like [Ipomoea batatas]
MSTPAAAMVVNMNGALQEFRRPVKAADVLSDNPNCFLSNSEAMNVNSAMPQVAGDEDLQLGQLYFLLPVSMSHAPLSLQDMCALAIKASAALNDYYSPVAGAVLRRGSFNERVSDGCEWHPEQRAKRRRGSSCCIAYALRGSLGLNFSLGKNNCSHCKHNEASFSTIKTLLYLCDNNINNMWCTRFKLCPWRQSPRSSTAVTEGSSERKGLSDQEWKDECSLVCNPRADEGLASLQ